MLYIVVLSYYNRETLMVQVAESAKEALEKLKQNADVKDFYHYRQCACGWPKSEASVDAQMLLCLERYHEKSQVAIPLPSLV